MLVYLTTQIDSPTDIDIDEEEGEGGGYTGLDEHGDRDSPYDLSHSNHSNFLNNEDFINSEDNTQTDIHHDMSGQFRGEDSPRLGFLESDKVKCDSSHLNSIFQRVGAAFSSGDHLDSGNVSYDSSSTSKSTLRPLPLFSYDRRSQERERECPGFVCVYMCLYIDISIYFYTVICRYTCLHTFCTYCTCTYNMYIYIINIHSHIFRYPKKVPRCVSSDS
jgi:hypothetical protein